MARALNEADSSKKKLTVEGQDLARQIEDAEAYIAELGKTKISLTTQVGNYVYAKQLSAEWRVANVKQWSSLSVLTCSRGRGAPPGSE